MPTLKFVDVQLLRFRAMRVSLSSSDTINWDPLNESSFLAVNVTVASVVTTIVFTMPAVSGLTSPSGLEILVAVETGPSGTGATVVWPAAFKFQTAGDAIPNAAASSVTIWRGLVLPSNTNIYMTKLGEWV